MVGSEVIETSCSAYETDILPLNYEPKMVGLKRIKLLYAACKTAVLSLNYKPKKQYGRTIQTRTGNCSVSESSDKPFHHSPISYRSRINHYKLRKTSFAASATFGLAKSAFTVVGSGVHWSSRP